MRSGRERQLAHRPAERRRDAVTSASSDRHDHRRLRVRHQRFGDLGAIAWTPRSCSASACAARCRARSRPSTSSGRGRCTGFRGRRTACRAARPTSPARRPRRMRAVMRSRSAGSAVERGLDEPAVRPEVVRDRARDTPASRPTVLRPASSVHVARTRARRHRGSPYARIGIAPRRAARRSPRPAIRSPRKVAHLGARLRTGLAGEPSARNVSCLLARCAIVVSPAHNKRGGLNINETQRTIHNMCNALSQAISQAFTCQPVDVRRQRGLPRTPPDPLPARRLPRPSRARRSRFPSAPSSCSSSRTSSTRGRARTGCNASSMTRAASSTRSARDRLADGRPRHSSPRCPPARSATPTPTFMKRARPDARRVRRPRPPMSTSRARRTSSSGSVRPTICGTS